MAAYTTAPTMVMPTADQVKTTPVPTALTMATQTKAAPAATNLANTMLAMTETAKEVPTPTTTVTAVTVPTTAIQTETHAAVRLTDTMPIEQATTQAIPMAMRTGY